MSKHFKPQEVSVGELHQVLLGTVAPRPIAFASTINKAGLVNLSPFSFFNVFSANPPIMIFSPARRVRDNTTKDTLHNVQEVPEVVINIVDYNQVEQMSLSSTEYPSDVNEFEKSGLTPIGSQIVQPPRVEESPASFECKVVEVRPLGEEGGAGNLIICEVLMIHLADRIFDSTGKIDPYKLNSIARLGGNWYNRVVPGSLFEVAKPIAKMGIGVDQIPEVIRFSSVLTGNDLGKLGNVESVPNQQEIESFASEPEVSAILESLSEDPDLRTQELHKLATHYLAAGDVLSAWKTLLQG